MEFDLNRPPPSMHHESVKPDAPAGGVWSFDQESQTVWLCSVSATILGFSGDQPIRLTLSDWMEKVHPDQREVLNRHLQAPTTTEWVISHRMAGDPNTHQPAEPIGARLWPWGVQLRGLTERTAQGQVLRVSGSMQIWLQQSEHGRAERPWAQPQSHDSLLSIAGRVARLGGWSVELPGMQVQWSDEVAAIYRVPAGYTPVMSSGLDFVAPSYRAQAREAFERCHTRGIPWDLELQIVTAEGDLRWIRSIGQAQRDDTGHVVRLWGAIQDITPRKQAEAERLATMQQLHDVSSSLEIALSVTGLGVARLDLVSDKAYCNENLCAILGRPHSAEGRPRKEWEEVFHPEDLRAARADLRRLLAGGASVVSEFRVVRADGAIRYLSGQHTLQRNVHGKPVSTTLVVHDVTEQRQAQAARQAQALAEQANRAKSEFLARMSHELRTPLNAILGFAEILEADQSLFLDPTQRKRVERIRSAGGHLLELINDLLDVSRIETGSLRLQLTSVDLLVEVREALRLAGNQAIARQVSLDLHTPDKLNQLWVHGDRTRLRQVALNLLTNAIKYNRPRGKVIVTIESDPNGVLLRVKDTGLGMNSQQLTHLFQPFNRLGKEHSTIEGAGIGLVITKHLVELMGGEITVSSQPRLGTEFVTRFKAAVPLEDAPHDEVTPPPNESTAAHPGPMLGRVLYIEDNAVNRALIEGYVSLRPGIQLEMTIDGESGIAAAQKETPDLILIDMMLPDLHGLDVIRRLRAVEALKHVRCIAVSANAMPQQIEEASRAGFDGYLTKPVSLQLLLAELDRLA